MTEVFFCAQCGDDSCCQDCCEILHAAPRTVRTAQENLHNCSDCGRRMCDPLTPLWVDCGCREGDFCRSCQDNME